MEMNHLILVRWVLGPLHLGGFWTPCSIVFSVGAAWDPANEGCSSDTPLVSLLEPSPLSLVLSTQLSPCNLREPQGPNCMKLGGFGLGHSFLEHAADVCIRQFPL